MTVLTLFTLAGNEDSIIITHAGPYENGKYSGWITHDAGKYYRPIVTTEPVFNTAEAAEEKMRGLVEIAKIFTDKEFTDPGSVIRQFFESPEGTAVGKVLAAAGQIEKEVVRDMKGR